MLIGEAEHWWRSTYQMLVARGITVDWECFRTMFMEKYFSESVRHTKEAEFLRLHQGGLYQSTRRGSSTWLVFIHRLFLRPGSAESLLRV
uniref:Retrotransposon gag domain-containing protein n=1 Tax=Cajanus cajan TaxID=3821 RepID=A0A151S8W7_CAJCA|nr:hypothetical protein KK1_026918 [Cajanus cajan]